MAYLTRLLGHAAGGRPAVRLMASLGLPQSDDTILRSLKRHPGARDEAAMLRVVGIDDWAWQKGCRYGTIMVDLEQREVVDVLPDRSVEATSRWLGQHSGVEVVSRDRCGLYAEGARQGAPQANQVADRFHLLQNLRQTIEQQLSRAPRPTRQPLSPANTEAEARDRRWMDGSWAAASVGGTPTPGLDRPQGRLYGHVQPSESLTACRPRRRRDCPSDGVPLAHSREMGAARRAARAQRDGAEAKHAKRFPRLSCPTLGRGLHFRAGLAAGDQRPWLHGQPVSSGPAAGGLAPCRPSCHRRRRSRLQHPSYSIR